MFKVISKTENGHIFICAKCDMFHIEYKNLNFNFKNRKDYQSFANYFIKLKGEHWEGLNKEAHFKRKIIVPIGHKNFNVLLNNEELLELKQLFVEGGASQSKGKTLNKLDVNYPYSLN